ncbi:MAG: hypothetical protein QXP36_03300 [Conexivisphaerales archaeon]
MARKRDESSEEENLRLAVTLEEFQKMVVSLVFSNQAKSLQSLSADDFYKKFLGGNLLKDSRYFTTKLSLVGDPGYGKTSSIYNVAYELLSSGKFDPVIAYVNLPNFSKDDMLGFPKLEDEYFVNLLSATFLRPVDLAIQKTISFDASNRIKDVFFKDNIDFESFKNFLNQYIHSTSAGRHVEVTNSHTTLSNSKQVDVETWNIKYTPLIQEKSSKKTPFVNVTFRVEGNSEYTIQIVNKMYELRGMFIVEFPERRHVFTLKKVGDNEFVKTYTEYYDGKIVWKENPLEKDANNDIEFYESVRQKFVPLFFVFDEFTNVNATQQALISMLVETGQIGNSILIPGPIRKNTIFTMFGNLENVSTVQSEESNILTNRGLSFVLKKDISSLKEYAIEHEWHPAVVAFIAMYGDKMVNIDIASRGESAPTPTPRSLELVSSTLQSFEDACKTMDDMLMDMWFDNDDLIQGNKRELFESEKKANITRLIAGAVGKDFAPLIMHLYEINGKVPMPDEILVKGVLPHFENVPKEDEAVIKFIATYTVMNYLRTGIMRDIGGEVYQNLDKIFGKEESKQKHEGKESQSLDVGNLGKFIISLAPPNSANNVGKDYQFLLLKEVYESVYGWSEGSKLTEEQRKAIAHMQNVAARWFEEISSVKEIREELDKIVKLRNLSKGIARE